MASTPSILTDDTPVTPADILMFRDLHGIGSNHTMQCLIGASEEFWKKATRGDNLYAPLEDKHTPVALILRYYDTFPEKLDHFLRDERDVSAVRQRIGVTPREFALMFGRAGRMGYRWESNEESSAGSNHIHLVTWILSKIAHDSEAMQSYFRAVEEEAYSRGITAIWGQEYWWPKTADGTKFWPPDRAFEEAASNMEMLRLQANLSSHSIQCLLKITSSLWSRLSNGAFRWSTPAPHVLNILARWLLDNPEYIEMISPFNSDVDAMAERFNDTPQHMSLYLGRHSASYHRWMKGSTPDMAVQRLLAMLGDLSDNEIAIYKDLVNTEANARGYDIWRTRAWTSMTHEELNARRREKDRERRKQQSRGA